MTEREIFTAALTKEVPTERAAFLDEACAGDAVLRQRIESLLAEHQQLGSFMDVPSLAATIVASPLERPGTQIGPYKLLQQIGEGGMGVVYLAEQTEPVKRRVALKIIKPGRETRQVIARFDAERQALAMMDHPNIAKVLDAGATASGRPFFVMELVRGIPITNYCDQHHLTPGERLELFVAVCQAVQHAHTKGIIHRDIKPTNVLVTLHDDKPVVKVIDFGIAKATTGQLTDKALFTGFAQMIGTPLYMSPEQAGLSGLDIDTRSDIYSLGVLLYELLTGTTPFDKGRLQRAAYDEVRRIIREEDPPKPSTRLSDLRGPLGPRVGCDSRSESTTLASISAQRHTEPAKLTKLVKGDLDWIVMKALEKERTRRYETANGFAADVLRYLADEPVAACPPSAAYRFRKFARRNKGTLTTATVVAVALITGTVISTWQAIRAIRAEGVAQAQRREAEAQRARAEANLGKARQAVEDYFTLVSESTLLDVPGLQPLRKALLETALRYYQGMLDQRSDDAVVLADSAVAYLRLANVCHEVNRNDDGLAATEAALDAVERLRREHPRATEAHLRLAGYWKVQRSMASGTAMPKDPLAAERTLIRLLEHWQAFVQENPGVEGFQHDLASINRFLGRLEAGRGAAGDVAGYTRSANYYRQAAANWEGLGQKQPEVRSYRDNLAGVYEEMAWPLRQAGLPDEANTAADQAQALYEGLAVAFPDVPTYRSELADLLLGLGDRLAAAGRNSEAEAAFHRSSDLVVELMAQYPWVSRYSHLQAESAQGLIGLSPQSGPEALEFFTKAIEKLPADAHLWHARGVIYLALQRPQDALTDFSLAIQMSPSENGDLPEWYDQHANLCIELELPEKALADYAEAMERWPTFWEPWAWRAFFHHNRQEWGQAIADYSRVLELNPAYVPAWQSRAVCAARLGRWGEALADYDQALTLDPTSADRHYDLAWLLATCPDASLRDPARAVELAKKAVELTPQAANVWNALGVAQYRAGDWTAAVEALTRSIEVRGGGDSFQWFFLAMADRQLGHKDEARTWYDRAVAWMEKNRPADDELARFRAEAAELLGIEYVRQSVAAGTQEDGRRSPREQAQALLKGLSVADAPAVLLAAADLQMQAGDAYRVATESRPAEHAYRTVIALCEALPPEVSDATSREALCLAHVYLGWQLSASNLPAEAEKDYREALALAEKLAADFPDVPNYRSHVAHRQYDLAALYATMGRAQEAEQAYRRALPLLDKLAVEPPVNPYFRMMLAATHKNLADLLADSQRHQEAKDAYRQAIELLAVLSAEFPDNSEYRSRLESLGSGEYSAFNGFFLAMAEWRLDHPEQARKWYDRAVEWMEKNQPQNEELRRLQAEAAELLKIDQQQTSPPE